MRVRVAGFAVPLQQALWILLLLGAMSPAQVRVPAGRVVDLTQVISEQAPVFMPAMRLEIANPEEEGEVGRKLGIYGRRFCASEHLGTHVDAPNHFGGRDRKAVDQLEAAQLVAHAVVVDVTAAVTSTTTARATSCELSIWSTALRSRPPKWLGASTCVPRCSETQNRRP